MDIDNNHLDLAASSDKAEELSENFPGDPPREVVQHIFRFLSPESLARVRCVNHYFQENADELMKVRSYWAGVLGRLRPKAAITRLGELYEHSQALQGNDTDGFSRISFDREALTTIWLKASTFRGLTDKILMAVYLFSEDQHQSMRRGWMIDQGLSGGEGSGFLMISREVVDDFWEDVVAEVNGLLVSSSPVTSVITSESFMELFMRPMLGGNRTWLCHQLSLPQCLFDNEVVVKALVEIQPCILELASLAMKNNDDVVLTAIQQDGSVLLYASDRLRNDHQFVLSAIKKNEMLLPYAGKAFQDNKEIVLTAVERAGGLLKFASERLRNDREVVLLALQEEGRALKYASEQIRNDREVALSAVHENGRALKYAMELPRNDKEVVLTAVHQYGHSIQYASETLKNDREVVLVAIHESGSKSVSVLHWASKALQNDREIVLAAVQQNGLALEFANEVFQNDPEIVFVAVQQCASALKFASDELKKDTEIVLVALEQDEYALSYASDELWDDEDLLIEAIRLNSRVINSMYVKVAHDRILRYRVESAFPGLLESARLAYQSAVSDNMMRDMFTVTVSGLRPTLMSEEAGDSFSLRR